MEGWIPRQSNPSIAWSEKTSTPCLHGSEIHVQTNHQVSFLPFFFLLVNTVKSIVLNIFLTMNYMDRDFKIAGSSSRIGN